VEGAQKAIRGEQSLRDRRFAITASSSSPWRTPS